MNVNNVVDLLLNEDQDVGQDVGSFVQDFYWEKYSREVGGDPIAKMMRAASLDDMVTILGRLGVSMKHIIGIFAEVFVTTLPSYELAVPGDTRPRDALNRVREWVAGKSTKEFAKQAEADLARVIADFDTKERHRINSTAQAYVTALTWLLGAVRHESMYLVRIIIVYTTESSVPINTFRQVAIRTLRECAPFSFKHER